MVNILYGIAGEGSGHAIRSKVVLNHLRKNHKIKVVTAGQSYSRLNKLFNCEKIDHFKIVYKNNTTYYLTTILYNFLRLPLLIARGWKVKNIINKFRPDLIITDFEPFVDYFAFFKKIPVITIDNQHMFTEAYNKDIPKKYFFDLLIAKIIIKMFMIKADKHFITAYTTPKTKKGSFLIKPLLRKEILNAKSKEKNYILVYQTSKSNKKLITELKKIKETFVVYGFDKNQNLGNVIIKDFNEKGFIEDLKDCKAVIANGGFTLIGEALYLKKPILSIPVKNHFEQIFNALNIEKYNYGMFTKKTDKTLIEKFIKNLSKYDLNNYKKYNNKEAFKKIDNAIKLLS
jgi:uncharacterized protein (TIGR00661 family)